MIFTMLVGAWFLIHQHCCFADAGSPRNIMVDPLMRRSPLENNFIRFGRSPHHTSTLELNHVPQSHGNSVGLGQRITRRMDNMIRFGRTIGSSTGVKMRDDEANRNSVLPPDTNHGLMLTAIDLEHLNNFHSKSRDDDLMFLRMNRSKDNIIRFGRSNAMLNKNKKYSDHNVDYYIRYGRKDSEDDSRVVSNSLPMDRGRKKSWKNLGVIRLGRSADHSHFSEDKREKRFLTTGKGGTRCYNSVEVCKSCFLEKTLDPTTLVASEFSLLPKIPFQHTPLKKNFIRFG